MNLALPDHQEYRDLMRDRSVCDEMTLTHHHIDIMFTLNITPAWLQVVMHVFMSCSSGVMLMHSYKWSIVKILILPVQWWSIIVARGLFMLISVARWSIIVCQCTGNMQKWSIMCLHMLSVQRWSIMCLQCTGNWSIIDITSIGARWLEVSNNVSIILF